MQPGAYYIAVVGDIVNSKQTSSHYGIDRSQAQKILSNVLESVNNDGSFIEDIASNFTITLGDEFQGLLRNGRNLMKIIMFIENKIYPIQVRFGIGIGKLQTEIYRFAALGADGDAYYRARDMIESIKSSEKKNKSIFTTIAVKADGKEKLIESQINTILALSSSIKKRLTEKQLRIINYLLQNDENQVQAAQDLNIPQPHINRTIRASDYYALRNATEVVQQSIDFLLKKQG